MVRHIDIDHTGLTGTGGSVATDAIWDTAGDLAVGSGANTAAKLVLGAAGGAVSRVNGAVAWNSGTAFPTAATGDRYWRTDRGLEYYYDGTRWLTTNQYILHTTPRSTQSAGLSATATLGNAPTRGASGDVYLEVWRLAAFASGGAFDATNYWALTLDKIDAANAATTISTVTMNSQTANNWKEWTATINAVVVGASFVAYRMVATKTLSPATLYVGSELTYRLVG